MLLSAAECSGLLRTASDCFGLPRQARGVALELYVYEKCGSKDEDAWPRLSWHREMRIHLPDRGEACYAYLHFIHDMYLVLPDVTLFLHEPPLALAADLPRPACRPSVAFHGLPPTFHGLPGLPPTFHGLRTQVTLFLHGDGTRLTLPFSPTLSAPPGPQPSMLKQTRAFSRQLFHSGARFCWLLIASTSDCILRAALPQRCGSVASRRSPGLLVASDGLPMHSDAFGRLLIASAGFGPPLAGLWEDTFRAVAGSVSDYPYVVIAKPSDCLELGLTTDCQQGPQDFFS